MSSILAGTLITWQCCQRVCKEDQKSAMTVRFFVSRGSEDGNPWPPDHFHEAQSAITICKNMWQAFNHVEDTYCVFANLMRLGFEYDVQMAGADLLIASQRGIGIVELKHYFGRISRKPDNTWYAGKKKIGCGKYNNPHEQVQTYAKEIRSRILPLIAPKQDKGKEDRLNEIKMQTGVCFTHPEATIEAFAKSELENRPSPHLQPWERFNVFNVDKISSWAAGLRFETSIRKGRGFRQFILSHNQVLTIPTVTGGIEWSEIYNLMPTGKPFAYLALAEGQRQTHLFGLDREEVFLGRDPQRCIVTAPHYCINVSRTHARVTRELDTVFIEDLASKNGTFIDEKRINRRQALKHGQIIKLGGLSDKSKNCTFIFLTDLKSDISFFSTAQNSTWLEKGQDNFKKAHLDDFSRGSTKS